MVSLDIPCPVSEYTERDRMKYITLITPSESEFSKRLTCSHMVRFLLFDDDKYLEITEGRVKNSNLSPKKAVLYDVDYIRECRLSKILKKEWNINYGAPSPEEMILSSEGSISSDTLMKVVTLEKINYSLSDFNKRYGRYIKKKSAS